MKNTVLILGFLLCLSCNSVQIGQSTQPDTKAQLDPSTQPTATTTPGTVSRVPVNSEIVDLIIKNEKNLVDLKYYLSKPFMLKIDEQKKVAEVVINGNGMLEINPANDNRPNLDFSVEDEEKLMDRLNGGMDFLIFYQKQNTTLRFRKNIQQDCFELFLVFLDNKSYNIRFDGEPPRLSVYGQDNRTTEGRVNLISNTPPDNQQQYKGNDNRQYQIIPSGNFDEYPDFNIEGRYTPNKNGVINYIKSNNRSLRWDIDPLITIYVNEAREEGINPYLAIA
jgi:hypothetical protein